MNINLTLIGQSITFAIFVWFCMKFIWPPIVAALDERKQKIADGLAAAERGAREQELAQEKAIAVIKEAKEQARTIISQAEKRNAEIVDLAKDEAREEAERIIIAAKAEVEQEANRAREELRGKVIDLALAGASKILEREVKIEDHNASLEKLSASL
ncbi:MAG: F0F1 ATP synthase subunit B [Gammaproteobacteria bacterium]|nr:F0F1 ATP synthase subunit B [Gammaproteobacteria bacterium]